jgi:hypothetical protein
MLDANRPRSGRRGPTISAMDVHHAPRRAAGATEELKGSSWEKWTVCSPEKTGSRSARPPRESPIWKRRAERRWYVRDDAATVCGTSLLRLEARRDFLHASNGWAFSGERRATEGSERTRAKARARVRCNAMLAASSSRSGWRGRTIFATDADHAPRRPLMPESTRRLTWEKRPRAREHAEGEGHPAAAGATAPELLHPRLTVGRSAASGERPKGASAPERKRGRESAATPC